MKRLLMLFIGILTSISIFSKIEIDTVMDIECKDPQYLDSISIYGILGKYDTALQITNKTNGRLYIEWKNSRQKTFIDSEPESVDWDLKNYLKLKSKGSELFEEEAVSSGEKSLIKHIAPVPTVAYNYKESKINKGCVSALRFLIPIRFQSGKIVDYIITITAKKVEE